MKRKPNLKLYLMRSSPAILTFAGTVGVIAAAVMAVRKTPGALAALSEREKEKREKLTKVEMVKCAGPIYAPSVCIGLSAIACIWAATILSKKNQASILSAYALLGESYKKYRNAAVDVCGEDADWKIKAEMAKERYISADGWSLYSPDMDTEDEKMLFYDFYSQRYFTSTFAAVINAEYHLNRNLALKWEVTLNEFYDFLGIGNVESGDRIGWSIEKFLNNEILWLDFDNRRTELDDGLECCIITFAFDPEPLLE